MRIEGRLLTPIGFLSGALEVGPDGRIARVEGSPMEEGQLKESNAPIILPGFIDLHVHGGEGHDIMDGGESAAQVARFHARHGTTAIAATTMTAPPEDLEVAFRGLSACVRTRPKQGAAILGVHLEGPYINPERLGAQPGHTRPMALEELRFLHGIAPIRIITLAPEIPANRSAIAALRAEGIRVQLGHTQGTYEDAVEALGLGASGFTHLFNAMPGLHHRAPGMVGAALALAEYAEIIPDLLHVHPGAIRAALRAIPRLYCVTDSTAAAGMPDGEYRLGRHPDAVPGLCPDTAWGSTRGGFPPPRASEREDARAADRWDAERAKGAGGPPSFMVVTKCLGGVQLPDGTLAGSALTMDQALRNLAHTLGLSLVEASRRLSTHAAQHLGLQDRGQLSEGAWADAVVLDRDLAIRGVMVEGEWLDAHA